MHLAHSPAAVIVFSRSPAAATPRLLKNSRSRPDVLMFLSDEIAKS